MHPRTLDQRDAEHPLHSLVFPAYNPGPALVRTIREVERFLGTTSESWEVLFVCDGCTDETPARLAALVEAEPDRVRVLAHSPNRGKGFAVRRGLAAARGRWRVFTDVDLAYGFDDVVRVTRTLKSGADVAIASRVHPDSRLIMSPAVQGYAYRRYLQSLVFSRLVRTLLPVRQRDTQAGLKGMSARVAELILPELRCDGFEFDCEFLTACAHFGVPVTEVPVWVRYENAVSTTGPRSITAMITRLWRIRRAWRSRVSPLPERQSAIETPPRRHAA
jgi:glycosyltransferase involved in cell wall biosynthesis